MLSQVSGCQWLHRHELDHDVIPKTLALLQNIAPGRHVKPSEPCFDERELAELARILRRLLYSPSELRKRLQAHGVNVSPANFYSEIPMIEDVERTSADMPQQGIYDRIFNPHTMLRWLEELTPFSGEFDPPLDLPENDARYRWRCQFSFCDAMAYHCFVRRLNPACIVEVGSGYSTLIAQDACDINGSGHIVCIEPFPRPFLPGLKRVTLVQQPVQEKDVEFFNSRLSDGDILFIDSTHTVKHGSDVLHLYLTILPQIRRNIVVHVHDVHIPRAMPINLLRDKQIYWTEQYLLYAYLLDNPKIEVLFGSSYNFIHNRARLDKFMHGRFQPGGASFWFRYDGRSGRTEADQDRSQTQPSGHIPVPGTGRSDRHTS
jgi:hypothetical protein